MTAFARSLFLFITVLGGAALAGPESRALRDGVRLHNSGRYREAISQFEQAFAKDPSLTRALLLLGASSLNIGRAEETVSYYERYLQTEKQLRVEEQARVRSYFEEAAAKFEGDHGRDPQKSELLLFAGRARFLLGQLARALGDYERFHKSGRPIGEGYQSRLMGYYLDLRTRLEEEDRRDPKQKEILLLLSRVCSGLGQREEAESYRQRYQQLLPRPAVVVQRPPPASRPLWRLITGGAAAALGLGLSGFGISALVVDGSCARMIEPPQYGCSFDYATATVGAGLLGTGAALVVGGTLLMALPRHTRRDALTLGLHGSGLRLAGVF